MADSKKKLSIVCFSGDFDKAVAAFTMASGAAAVNYEVNLFFTFWGLNIIKKRPGRTWIGKGLLARIFNPRSHETGPYRRGERGNRRADVS